MPTVAKPLYDLPGGDFREIYQSLSRKRKDDVANSAINMLLDVMAERFLYQYRKKIMEAVTPQDRENYLAGHLNAAFKSISEICDETLSDELRKSSLDGEQALDQELVIALVGSAVHSIRTEIDTERTKGLTGNPPRAICHELQRVIDERVVLLRSMLGDAKQQCDFDDVLFAIGELIQVKFAYDLTHCDVFAAVRRGASRLWTDRKNGWTGSVRTFDSAAFDNLLLTDRFALPKLKATHRNDEALRKFLYEIRRPVVDFFRDSMIHKNIYGLVADATVHRKMAPKIESQNGMGVFK